MTQRPDPDPVVYLMTGSRNVWTLRRNGVKLAKSGVVAKIQDRMNVTAMLEAIRSGNTTITRILFADGTKREMTWTRSSAEQAINNSFIDSILDPYRHLTEEERSELDALKKAVEDRLIDQDSEGTEPLDGPGKPV